MGTTRPQVPTNTVDDQVRWDQDIARRISDLERSVAALSGAGWQPFTCEVVHGPIGTQIGTMTTTEARWLRLPGGLILWRMAASFTRTMVNPGAPFEPLTEGLPPQQSDGDVWEAGSTGTFHRTGVPAELVIAHPAPETPRRLSLHRDGAPLDSDSVADGDRFVLQGLYIGRQPSDLATADTLRNAYRAADEAAGAIADVGYADEGPATVPAVFRRADGPGFVFPPAPSAVGVGNVVDFGPVYLEGTASFHVVIVSKADDPARLTPTALVNVDSTNAADRRFTLHEVAGRLRFDVRQADGTLAGVETVDTLDVLPAGIRAVFDVNMAPVLRLFGGDGAADPLSWPELAVTVITPASPGSPVASSGLSLPLTVNGRATDGADPAQHGLVVSKVAVAAPVGAMPVVDYVATRDLPAVIDVSASSVDLTVTGGAGTATIGRAAAEATSLIVTDAGTVLYPPSPAAPVTLPVDGFDPLDKARSASLLWVGRLGNPSPVDGLLVGLPAGVQRFAVDRVAGSSVLRAWADDLTNAVSVDVDAASIEGRRVAVIARLLRSVDGSGSLSLDVFDRTRRVAGATVDAAAVGTIVMPAPLSSTGQLNGGVELVAGTDLEAWTDDEALRIARAVLAPTPIT